MMPQVVTTGAVIGTGPRVKMTGMVSGDSVMARFLRASRVIGGQGCRANDVMTKRAMITPSAVSSSGSAPCQAARTSTRPMQRQARELQRDRAQRAAGDEEPRVPAQQVKCSSAGGDAEGERKPVSSSALMRVCIHRQADQQPSTRPSSSSGAVQKIPVPKRRSSQRPRNMPSRVGSDDEPAEDADQRQPGARSEGSPCATSAAARSRRRRHRAASMSVAPRLGHDVSSVGRPGRRAAMIWRIAAMCRRVAVDALGALGLQVGAEAGEHDVFELVEVVAELIASRVAMATSLPPRTVSTPRRTAQ